LTAQQNRLQNQVATGKHISQLSDDPSTMRQVLDLQVQDSQIGQYRKNIASLQTQATSSYNAIATGVQPNYGETALSAACPTGASPSTKSSSATTDSYYVNLFVESPGWSSPTANADEAARWARIEPFVRDIATRTQRVNQAPLRILDVGCGRGWLRSFSGPPT
jgi:hypothetical protein